MQGDSKLMELAYAGLFGTLFPLFLFAAGHVKDDVPRALELTGGAPDSVEVRK